MQLWRWPVTAKPALRKALIKDRDAVLGTHRIREPTPPRGHGDIVIHDYRTVPSARDSRSGGNSSASGPRCFCSGGVLTVSTVRHGYSLPYRGEPQCGCWSLSGQASQLPIYGVRSPSLLPRPILHRVVLLVPRPRWGLPANEPMAPPADACETAKGPAVAARPLGRSSWGDRRWFVGRCSHDQPVAFLRERRFGFTSASTAGASTLSAAAEVLFRFS
jgi:hypothetical protein